MAKYTMTVFDIVKSYADENQPFTDMLEEAAPLIFNFYYPIWEDSYRQTLNVKILGAYIMREIAHETVALWKLRLNIFMNEIMPYYNEVYLTTLERFDGANDIDITSIFDRNISSNLIETGTGKNDTSTKNTGSEYPQGIVSGSDVNFYATTSNDLGSESVGNSNRTADTDGIEHTKQTRKGRLGARTQGDIIKAFRESIYDIDREIIKELKPLFNVLS